MHARSDPLPRRSSGRAGPDPDAEDPSGRRAGPDRPLPDPLSAPPLLPLHARQLAFVVGLVVVAWILFVFARAVTTTSAAQERAAAVRADNAAQEARLAADQEELRIVQGQPFIRLQARAYGVGAPGERPFSLAAEGPSPSPIAPLGAPVAAPAPQTPMGAWLDLLFGP